MERIFQGSPEGRVLILAWCMLNSRRFINVVEGCCMMLWCTLCMVVEEVYEEYRDNVWRYGEGVR